MKKIPSDMIAGIIYETNNFGVLEVVQYNKTLDVDVMFLGTGFKCKASSGNIRKGEVRDRLVKTVCGVGFWGLSGIENPSKHRSYTTWVNMIKRCYDNITLMANPTYFGCSVCSEWHNFQNFAKWFDDNYIEGRQLDKDVKVKGNKVYSPETCSFVTHQENSSEAHEKSYSLIDPSGVLVEVVNIKRKADELGISANGLYAVARGAQLSYKGWTIASDRTEMKSILLSAANELKSLIDEKNGAMKASISPADSNEPEWHDYQTCQELVDIAKKI